MVFLQEDATVITMSHRGWRTVVFLTQGTQTDKPMERECIASEIRSYLRRGDAMGILEPMGVIGSRRDSMRLNEELPEGVAKMDEFWSDNPVEFLEEKCKEKGSTPRRSAYLER